MISNDPATAELYRLLDQHRDYWKAFIFKARQILDVFDQKAPEWLTHFAELRANFDPAGQERIRAEVFILKGEALPQWVRRCVERAYLATRQDPLCEAGHESSPAQESARLAAVNFLRLAVTSFSRAWRRRPCAPVVSLQVFAQHQGKRLQR